MAYQQYDNRQQPRQQQQQYYDQGPPQAGRQQAGYNDQYADQYYDDGGYDQQWDDGYYDQQQQNGWGNGQAHQQYQGAYEGHAQMRQPPPHGRRPPPRDQYPQDMYDDGMHQQQRQGPDPRDRRMGPDGASPREGMQRGDSRGRRNGHPPELHHGPQGLRPPGRGRGRAMLSPVSPMNLPQDNPFPSFPAQKTKPHPKLGSMDEAMSLMSLGQDQDNQARLQGPPHGGRGRGMGSPPQHRALPPGRGGFGGPDINRHDSGHAESNGYHQQMPNNRGIHQQRPPPMNMEGGRGPPQRPMHPASPTQQAFGPNTQRSMTMPQNMAAAANARGLEQQQQWNEPGATRGYNGPESPTYIPPRPATATGMKQNGYGRQQQYGPRPPMPQVPQHHQYNTQQSQDDTRGDLDNLYDDYYGDEGAQDRNSKATSIDMPDFDAMPEPSERHRRGLSIENHLSPTGSGPPMQSLTRTATAGPGDGSEAPTGNFHQQASKSRSQPDLHGQYSKSNGVYEMAGDAPAVPSFPIGRGGTPGPIGLPNGQRGRGPPPRGMTMDSPSRGPGHGFGGQSQHFDSQHGRQPPPMPRVYSGDSAHSEPPPNQMRNTPPMAPGNPIPRPGTAAPAPGRMRSDPMQRPSTTQPQQANPDALPAHPAPVRAGLTQQQGQAAVPQPPQASRPAPVRQYNTDPTPIGYGAQQPVSVPAQRRVSTNHPVTHDELNRLRNTWKMNPADSANGLQLAKKLVEAASVLADEGGTADTRTRNKNRERFINESHKIVKKLVSNGYGEAMFYMADCYGQGLLGLQPDTKEAFTLYQSAAKAGHAQSAYRTAVCCEMGHEEGGGTKRDPLKAVQWYRRAAALGDVSAQYKMGMILLKGLLGQQNNIGEAINMLKRAADQADENNPHSLHELGLIYEAQTGNERIIRDEPYAFQLFRQAAELGYKFSQFRLGQAYEYGMLGCPIDARSSLAWYTRAAAQEEHQSELALSGWYLTGSQGILDQSDTEAYLWARKAACAEPPLSKALFAMGYFTEVGIGCPRSLEEAKRWYGRAASYKFPKAQERLEELKKGGSKAQKGRERLSRTNQRQHEENCVVM
ncbi:hypothetical protein EJ04DRAFT_532923 [Polyplosphaeria fusca]|uniref:Uncharacterized protein n=1 Tax=Polyplosphaeria fusca TaxID=682080 RepID=A0A9P4R683_9PLEO|nr:hypothetical protein EJ04DRAFT_532923 [Polyplosphaeria fusca]